MNKEYESINQERFQVLCICCGAKIRNDEHEDANGLCLNCFYQLLNEQMQTQKVSGSGDFVSER